MKYIKLKYLNYAVILVMTSSVLSQIYSFVNLKAFWLDEWFILYNIKFRSYLGLFDNLYYMQQFPRIYLSVVKFISELFDYNYFSIRLLPFSFQVINILLVYFLISKILFRASRFKGLLFVLFFLSFHTTLFYFSQLKQYTIDIFFAFMSVYYFYYLSQNYQALKIKSTRYAGLLIFIFTGSFFSYTFPIVVTPIMICFFITFLSSVINKKFSIKSFLPIAIFIIALFINYFTDLQFVLTNKGQYQNFDMFVMNYSSIGAMLKSTLNIVWLFTSMFFFDKSFPVYFLGILYFIKVIILLTGLIGFVVIFYELLQKIKLDRFKYLQTFAFTNITSIEIYMLFLFFVTITLYLLRKLPLGTHRINYFCFVFATYFLLTGLFFMIRKFKKLKYLLIPVIIFAAFFHVIIANINEWKLNNVDFDQKIYANVGKAINAAKANSLPIVVSYNEFYPASIMEGQEGLMIKAHHDYKPKDSIPVVVVNKNELAETLRKIRIDKYILITKYNYKIILP